MPAAGLMERVGHHLTRERRMTELLHRNSKCVGLKTFADFEEFPVDAEGNMGWHDEMAVVLLREKIQEFFRFDAAFGQYRAQTMWPRYLAAAFPFMNWWSLEDMLVALCIRVWHHREQGRSTLHYVEYFAGAANLSRAAIEAGKVGVSLDVVANPEHDVLQAAGLRLWLLALSATKAGALMWIGCPCSSFTVMCRAQSGRSEENMFLGNVESYFVAEGNIFGDVTGLLLLLGIFLDVDDGLEQPHNSVLPQSACVRPVLEYGGSQQTVTYHFAFGGPSVKPLQLWSRREWMKQMARSKPSNGLLEYQLVKRESSGAFTGVKVLLQESQTYTMEFGRAIIRAWQRIRG